MNLYDEIKQNLDFLGIKYKENLCRKDLAIRGEFKNTTAWINKTDRDNIVLYGITYSSKDEKCTLECDLHTIIAYLSRFYFERNLKSP